MRAAVMKAYGEPLEIHDDWTDPECGPGDVVLEVKACGICRSDHTLWKGGMTWMGIVPPLPAVLGHEYAGVVVEAGDEVKGFRPGDRVVSPFCHGCGTCEMCESGHENVCSDLTLPGMHYTGGFAALTKVANADLNVVPLPDEIAFASAAGMGCRFITAYHGLVDQARVRPDEWVAVFACGGVGLSAVDIASGLGANVVAVSRSPEKLALAESLGATHTVTAGPTAVEEVVELTGGGAHVSVDALGAKETAIPAILSLRTRGRHLRLGASNAADAGEIPIPVDVVLFRELTIVGSFGMQASRYPEMLEMVSAGRVSPDRLVGDTVALEDASDVLATMDDYGTRGMAVIDRF